MERAADQSEQVLYQPVPEPALRSCRNTVIRLAAGGLNGAPQSRPVALRPFGLKNGLTRALLLFTD
jgi:hypothetical protein